MVYATCSILPSENEKQIENFLNSEQGKNFVLVKDKKILSLNVSQASAANQVEKVKPLSYMLSIEEDLNN